MIYFNMAEFQDMFKRGGCEILFGILHDEMLNDDVLRDGIDIVGTDLRL